MTDAREYAKWTKEDELRVIANTMHPLGYIRGLYRRHVDWNGDPMTWDLREELHRAALDRLWCTLPTPWP